MHGWRPSLKHLRPDEVVYSTRPRTIYEEHIWRVLDGLTSRDPNFYPMWSLFLWCRQDEVLPRELFNDILITDFPDHRVKCISAMAQDESVRRVLESLNDQWRFGFKDHDLDHSKLEEWHSKHRDS